MDNDNVGQLAGLVGPCPRCSNGVLRAVSDGEGTNFLCETCGTCWHPELAWVTRVNPTTCPGCPSAHVCAEGWAAPAATGAALQPDAALDLSPA